MTILQSCCKCFNLKAGATMIALLTMILSVLQFLGSIYLLITGFKDTYYVYNINMEAEGSAEDSWNLLLEDSKGTGCVRESVITHIQEGNYTLFAPSLLDIYDHTCLRKWVDVWSHMTLHGASVVALVVSILYLVVSAVFLHGIRVAKKTLFLPWMAFTVLQLGLLVAAVVIAVILAVRADIAAAFILIAAVAAATFLFWLYCLLVVLSYYQLLRQRGRRSSRA